MKRGSGIIILALLLAACGGTAAPSSTTAPATATAAPAAQAEATAVPATAAPAPATTAPAPASAVPATTAPAPTTAAPATAAPATSGVVPVVDPHQGFLLGGTRDGAWLTAAEIGPLITGNETYALYGPTAAAGQLSSSTAESIGVPCEDTLKVTLSGGSQDDLVAVGGLWNALPRVPEELATDTPAYQEAVKALLQEQGIAEPDVQITKILRVDLNADGVDEVLLTATRFTPGDSLPTAAAGDYSMAALRTVVNGAVQTTIIDQNIFPEAAEFAAPNTFTLRGTADLNGDGVLEVLVDSQYYEGAALIVYAVDGPQVTPVLGAGCGV